MKHSRFERYRAVLDVPESALCWNLYGVGLGHMGRNGRPERIAIPRPGPNELLARVDAVSLCFSDVKVCRLGNEHPKLRGRDLASEPTRLGHEVALTVAGVGAGLESLYRVGQRLALQPDIYRDGASIAYGYVIPGGLVQFQLLGPEILRGGYVLPVADSLGYAETALSEPWACVEAAYTQRRRLEPKPRGTAWIVGASSHHGSYEVSGALLSAATIVTTRLSPSLLDRLRRAFSGRIVERNDVSADEFRQFSREQTGGEGFDDIILLEPREARTVTAALAVLARGGTLNLMARGRLDAPVPVDVGRIHYDLLAIVGNTGPDIAASYGPERNRCELRPAGTLVVIGAGGPMGQMHVQRAIELSNGPQTIIASEVNVARLAALSSRFSPLAERHGKRLVAVDVSEDEQALDFAARRLAGGGGIDDVVVCVPTANAISAAARLLKPDGMLVIFAGVPHGTSVELDLSAVPRHAAQFTGTSGSTLADQEAILRKAGVGQLSMNHSVAAIGGIDSARDGLGAVMDARFAGKVVLFPQLANLPLTPLAELPQAHPRIANALDEGGMWSRRAESSLIEELWKP